MARNVAGVDASLQELMVQGRELAEAMQKLQHDHQASTADMSEADREQAELEALEAEISALEQQDQEQPQRSDPLSSFQRMNDELSSREVATRSNSQPSAIARTLDEAVKLKEDIQLLTHAMNLWSNFRKELAEDERVKRLEQDSNKHVNNDDDSGNSSNSGSSGVSSTGDSGSSSSSSSSSSSISSSRSIDSSGGGIDSNTSNRDDHSQSSSNNSESGGNMNNGAIVPNDGGKVDSSAADSGSEKVEESKFFALPVDMLCMCLLFLPLHERLQVFRTSSRFRLASQQSECWRGERLNLRIASERECGEFIKSMNEPLASASRFQCIRALQLQITFRPTTRVAQDRLLAALRQLAAPILEELLVPCDYVHVFSASASLRSLTLEGVGKGASLGDVNFSTFTQLATLNLFCQDVTGKDLERLSGLPALRRLDVSYCPLRDEDIRPLCALPLSSLSLAYNHLLTDFALCLLCGANSKATLETLDLSGCPEISAGGLGVLSKLPRLAELSLRDCPSILSFAALPPTITSLDLSLRHKASAPRAPPSAEGLGLSHLVSLTSLDMSWRNVSDPQVRSVLQSCTKLEVLSLRGCQLVSERCWGLPSERAADAALLIHVPPEAPAALPASLTRLDLRDCPLMTEATIDVLWKLARTTTVIC